jgi:hypothetical protein
VNRASTEIPHVTRLGRGRWQVKWAGRHPFEADDRVFSTIVRSLPRGAQRELFERLAQAMSEGQR